MGDLVREKPYCGGVPPAPPLVEVPDVEPVVAGGVVEPSVAGGVVEDVMAPLVPPAGAAEASGVVAAAGAAELEASDAVVSVFFLAQAPSVRRLTPASASAVFEIVVMGKSSTVDQTGIRVSADRSFRSVHLVLGAAERVAKVAFEGSKC